MTRRKPDSKVDLSTDKAQWHPSLLAGQIVLVTSRSVQGDVHAASKSWLTLVASQPPMLGLCCRLSHRTAINILETREFVINIPGEELASRIWGAGDTVSAAIESPEAAGWTMIPSSRISVPRVQECRGHIECVLDSTKRFNDEEMIFFARIVAVSIDDSLLKGSPEDRYRGLRSLIYLELDLFSVIDSARRLPT